MKIINKYVLKEHFGPFVFALSALTSLLLLQVIAKKFGDLVGKGLSWSVITEFFVLSVPYTLAMTLPMSWLVAVLYAFSRLASENEITALKAGGISTRSLLKPSLGAGAVLALFMLWFNDQVLPRANHELATLQMAILRTKPTFALKSQVINTIKESNLYLRAGQIDEGNAGLMKDMTIYDVSDGNRRRTIYADSGNLTLAPNLKDLNMRLHKGWMLSSPTNAPGQLNRIYFREDLLKVRDVANQFQSINADTASKGDREMSICEMQRQYDVANTSIERAKSDSLLTLWRMREERGTHTPPPPPATFKKAGGLGAVYCTIITKYLKVQEAHAAEVPRRHALVQDTTKKAVVVPQQQAPVGKAPDSVFVIVDGKTVKVGYHNIPPNAYFPNGVPAGAQAIKDAGAGAAVARPNAVQAPPVATPGGVPVITPGVVPGPAPAVLTPGTTGTPEPNANSVNIGSSMELHDAHLRLDEARYRRNRAVVEIQKKFSLAFACIVFVLVGAPIALRFPRGGVGLVIAGSFAVFAIYYVGLIGGESLANKNLISPFWAMWADNIFFMIAGILLISRMGKEGVTGRGGGNLGERIDATRDWFARQGRRVGLGSERAASL